jgi:hypothetical protein
MLDGAALIPMVKYGLGNHLSELSLHQNRELLKWIYIGSQFYGPTVLATKTALLMITIRVFPTRSLAAIGIRAFIGIMIVFYLVLQFLKAFICWPVAAVWDANIKDARCLSLGAVYIADSTFASVTDGIILVLPVFLSASLRISALRKLRVMVLLGAGGGAVGVAIYKTYLLVVLRATPDYSWDYARLFLWR